MSAVLPIHSLTNPEINAFLDELDPGNGSIPAEVIKAKLDAVCTELSERFDSAPTYSETRNAVLDLLTGSELLVPRLNVAGRLLESSIPSMEQEAQDTKNEQEYLRSIGRWRRLRSWWMIRGPEILFLILVLGLMAGVGAWQGVRVAKYRHAFGWGLILAKTCAGAIYPALFFSIISMSRYLSSILRWSTYTRYIRVDLSLAFHIRMSLAVVALATLHGIGHLGGTFVFGSRPSRQEAVEHVLGSKIKHGGYVDYIRTLAAITGLAALGLVYIVAAFSHPWIRKRHFNLFQLVHLLMYPIIGLLMAHGALALFQSPRLGYVLALPTFLIIAERVTRTYMGYRSLPASVRIVDSETVVVQFSIPAWRLWRHRPGQFVLLQVPALSRWQWHPFTISMCHGDDVQLHIKTDGNWTRRLRGLGQVEVGLSGPFGSPAESFYEYSHTILVGAGIGVTPFSGIMANLQAREDRMYGGPDTAPNASPIGDIVTNEKTRHWLPHSPPKPSPAASLRTRPSRRIDFHWIVRDRDHLGWFSNILNSVSRSQQWHRQKQDDSRLDIRLETHVTRSKTDIVTHVLSCLLERHRGHLKESLLTGLINPTQFGRPDFVDILNRHYDDMVRYKAERGGHELKVGVFFCGAPMIGQILSDRCALLTARGNVEGTRVRYHFYNEVFG